MLISLVAILANTIRIAAAIQVMIIEFVNMPLTPGMGSAKRGIWWPPSAMAGITDARVAIVSLLVKDRIAVVNFENSINDFLPLAQVEFVKFFTKSLQFI